jgi:hypothetical protein
MKALVRHRNPSSNGFVARVLVVGLLAACSHADQGTTTIADAGGDDVSWMPMPDGEVQDAGETPDPFGPFDRTTPTRPPPKDTGTQIIVEDSAVGDVASTDTTLPSDANIVADVDSGPLSTESILKGLSPDCYACAAMPDPTSQDISCLTSDNGNQGGICETLMGNAARGGLTEKALCLKVLAEIFQTKCGSTGDLTQCLCGTTDHGACIAGTTLPTGPVYLDYLDEWPFGGVGTIVANFTNQTFGAGMANALVQCLSAYTCDSCFGPKDGGAH